MIVLFNQGGRHGRIPNKFQSINDRLQANLMPATHEASALAGRAVEARALPLHDAADRRGADRAWQALTVVDPGLQLEVTRFTATAYVITQRAAACGNRCRQYFFDCGGQPR